MFLINGIYLYISDSWCTLLVSMNTKFGSRKFKTITIFMGEISRKSEKIGLYNYYVGISLSFFFL